MDMGTAAAARNIFDGPAKMMNNSFTTANNG